MKKNDEQIKRILPVLIPFLAALLLELFVFNFRSWQSMFYDPVSVPVSQLRTDGFKAFEEGVFKIESANGAVYIENADILCGGKQIHNIMIEIETPDAIDFTFGESGVVFLTPYLLDAGHSQLYSLARRPVRADIPVSQYIWLSGAGQINTVAFSVELSNGSLIKLKSIVLNARQELIFNPVRFILMLVICFFASGLRSKSSLWNKNEPEKGARGALIGIIGLAILIPAFILIFENDYLTANVNFQPYHELSRALATGRLYIDKEVPQWLINMDNPYDMSARDALSAETGEEYLWDYAYYNGHYYVYYGVVPCILFYLPFYLLTGSMLPNTLVIILCAVFLYVGIYVLLRQLFRRVENIPYALQIELFLCTFFGSLIIYFLNQPDAYAVPVVCGVVFTVWGLYFWLKYDAIKKVPLILAGSICMALVGGCRPHMLIYSLAAVPIFAPRLRHYIQTGNSKKKKEGMVAVTAFAIPYIIIGGCLMIYNGMRFGSVFNFGQGYNLTVQDGTNMVFSWDKVWIGIYEYLLKLPRLDYKFPFMSIPGDGTGSNSIGHSVLYMEYVFGGLLVCNPVCLFIVYMKNKTKDRDLLTNLTLFLGGGALIVFLADSVMPMAGVVYRYMADYSVVVILIAAIAVIVLWKDLEGSNAQNIVRVAMLICLTLAFLYNVNFYWLTGLKYPLLWGDTSLYYRIYYSFMFW